ncbi:MAG TPA: M14 family zinc carboxypeptidase [Solirubrobacterales bacterium]
MTRFVPTARGTVLLALLVALVVAVMPAAAQAEVVDPANCTETVQYDPSIPKFGAFAAKEGFANTSLGGFRTGTADRHPSAQLFAYGRAVANATTNNPRVRVVTREIGLTVEGRKFEYSIVSTPENLARVEQDAAFYRAVRAGEISKDAAIADIQANPRPAFGWITETPHGDEPAGGEASARMLYELAARTDCANMRRLQQMDLFINLARNPDGRDANTRTNAWGFDPNRDLMYQNHDINSAALDEVFKYPSLFFIDAHQQASGYFFPPNEDPVHHEISHFALDEIEKLIGPALQERFNDQSLQYRNYNRFDLFTPEYGDSVASLILGSAGMTYEKGSNEVYGKQVYDHYLAIDETVNVVSKEKDTLLEGWIAQWQEATEQGANCELQQNTLFSPLHDTIDQQPNIDICGYYFKPGLHSGDTAHILNLLEGRGVHVYRLDQSTTVEGAYDWGSDEPTAQTLPAGTLWIPTNQTMKHWINATLEEQPFIPYPFFFDVVNWSFSSLSSAAGNGQLQAPLPASAPITEVTGNLNLGTVTGADKPVLAFSTDSMEALGLVTELLEKGAAVFRAGEAFDAAGVHFPTGTALVDATTLGGVDLVALAAARQTPVTGLDTFPVARFPLTKPKIGIFVGNAVPNNPLTKTGTGHCAEESTVCEMLFVLPERMGIPRSMLAPVTSGEIAGGVLRNQNFTALVSNNVTLTAGAQATGLQAFVNAGGNYVVYGGNGATSMRNAGMTTVNTSTAEVENTWIEHCPDQNDPAAAGDLTTPGVTFSAEFNTDNPVAWGFDEGGYIWRNNSNLNTNPVFNPTTLAGNGTTIARADVAVSFADQLKAYGYQCNGLQPGRLGGRPFVIDQRFGAGHSTLIGTNAFFRAWTISTQRMVLNGILYPNAAAIPAGAPVAAAAGKAKVKLAAKPLLRKQLPAVKSRPVPATHNPHSDAVVTVKRAKLPVLKRIVRAAKLPARMAEKVEWVNGPGAGKVSMRIPGASGEEDLWVHRDLEFRPAWAWRIINGLVKHRLPHQDQI